LDHFGEVNEKRQWDLRPTTPAIIKVHPRYFEKGEMLLQIMVAGALGQRAVVATAARTFKDILPKIVILHLAVDVFDRSLHSFHAAMTVAKSRATAYDNGTIYFGSRKSPSQVVVYDKWREQRHRARHAHQTEIGSHQLSAIAKKHKHWVRVEARYKGPRCPVSRLQDLNHLLGINPFDRVELKPFEAADP